MICSKCGEIKIDNFYKSGEQRRSTNLCKECTKKFVSERRLFYKIHAVHIKGGKCEKCGYKDNVAALDFHHLESSEKEHGVCELIKNLANWDLIKKEIDKCILVCNRCHQELHHPDRFIDVINFEFDHSNILNKRKRYDIKNTKRICFFCKNSFLTKRESSKFCSKECFIKSREVAEKPDIELLKKLMINMTWEDIGARFNVSGNSVRKWAKQYGIFIERKNKNFLDNR